MALNIKPDAIGVEGTGRQVGYAAVLSDDGDPVGAVTVRPSETIPGYVTLVATCELGKAIRVPADWLSALDGVPQLDKT